MWNIISIPMRLHQIRPRSFGQGQPKDELIGDHSIATVDAYPKLPQARVSKRTRADGSVLNWFKTFWRSCWGTLPSKRRHRMSACSKPASTTLSVRRHKEKTMLKGSQSREIISLSTMSALETYHFTSNGCA
jgi:hypothetical protein